MKYTESEINQLTQTIFAEVEQAKHGGPFIVRSDVNLVWAVSSTGTVTEPAELGQENPYTGVLFDRDIVDESVRISTRCYSLARRQSNRRCDTSRY